MINRIIRYAFIIFLALFISCRQNLSQSGKLSDSAKTNAAKARGFLHKDGQTLFPIGFYELPRDDAELQRYVRSGVNLFRCSGKADLDRVAAAGALGWVPLGLTAGENEELKSKIASIADHPALVVWEGPDEIVHSFTRWSGLYRTLHVYKSRDEWEQQKPNAIAYSEKKAREIMPAMHKAIKMIRRMDSRNRPVWINEATNSDLKFVRQYVDAIDITGADSYPVKESERDVAVIGDITERWEKVGRNQNEDRRPHLGIEITGIDDLNGRDLQLLYGDEKFHVERGKLITRLTPLQVKVFATGRQWQSQQLKGDLKGLQDL
ncbi:MAG: hypothetical protein GWP06_13345 [Actinobacteria bacterium]|nr:hypothetical protein [Actinomycetota bacterium]